LPHAPALHAPELIAFVQAHASKNAASPAGWTVQPNPGGGDCFFYAIMEAILGRPPTRAEIMVARERIVQWASSNSAVLLKLAEIYGITTQAGIEELQHSLSAHLMMGTYAEDAIVYAALMYWNIDLTIYFGDTGMLSSFF
jgi:hypothetical protein